MKKKMKKLFSKLTILVLLVAMLIPYTSIPKVEAATDETCANGDWEYHTNYYFFSQAEHPLTWASYLATDNGTFSTSDDVATTYYTSFLYNFPYDGTTFEITDADFVTLTTAGNTSKINNTQAWSLKGFYNEMLKMYDSSKQYDYANPSSTYKSYSYSPTNNSGTSEDDSIITYLIHGPWGFAGLDDIDTANDYVLNDSESIISVESYQDANDDNASTNTIINELIDATVIPDSNTISRVNIGVERDLSTTNSEIQTIISSIKDYNRDKGELSKAGIKTNDKGDLVLKLYIRRSYTTNDFFTFNNIRYNDGTYYNSTASNAAALTSLGTDSKLYFPNIDGCDTSIENYSCNNSSYVTQGADGTESVSKPTAIKLSDDGSDNYWFLAPSLFQISYKVCKDGGTNEDEVALTYYSNEPADATEKATGTPEKQVQKKGTEFIISEDEPTLKGYKFQNWSLNENCSGDKYEAGYNLGELENNTPLFACWGSTNGTDSPGTGVLTYTGLFTGIIALAGGSYYLIKKKNLFKKI